MQNNYKWYPIYTNPRAEKKTYELLVKKSIEAYLPLKKMLKQWSDRKKWVWEPLLSSYLFVKIEPTGMADVLTTKGVSRFIYFSGKPATIPNEQIEQLKRILATDTDIIITSKQFEIGQAVKITTGPFQGLIGELVDFQSEKKLLIRIDHIGQSLLVQISPGYIN